MSHDETKHAQKVAAWRETNPTGTFCGQPDPDAYCGKPFVRGCDYHNYQYTLHADTAPQVTGVGGHPGPLRGEEARVLSEAAIAAARDGRHAEAWAAFRSAERAANQRLPEAYGQLVGLLTLHATAAVDECMTRGDYRGALAHVKMARRLSRDHERFKPLFNRVRRRQRAAVSGIARAIVRAPLSSEARQELLLALQVETGLDFHREAEAAARRRP